MIPTSAIASIYLAILAITTFDNQNIHVSAVLPSSGSLRSNTPSTSRGGGSLVRSNPPLLSNKFPLSLGLTGNRRFLNPSVNVDTCLPIPDLVAPYCHFVNAAQGTLQPRRLVCTRAVAGDNFNNDNDNKDGNGNEDNDEYDAEHGNDDDENWDQFWKQKDANEYDVKSSQEETSKVNENSGKKNENKNSNKNNNKNNKNRYRSRMAKPKSPEEARRALFHASQPRVYMHNDDAFQKDLQHISMLTSIQSLADFIPSVAVQNFLTGRWPDAHYHLYKPPMGALAKNPPVIKSSVYYEQNYTLITIGARTESAGEYFIREHYGISKYDNRPSSDKRDLLDGDYDEYYMRPISKSDLDTAPDASSSRAEKRSAHIQVGVSSLSHHKTFGHTFVNDALESENFFDMHWNEVMATIQKHAEKIFEKTPANNPILLATHSSNWEVHKTAGFFAIELTRLELERKYPVQAIVKDKTLSSDAKYDRIRKEFMAKVNEGQLYEDERVHLFMYQKRLKPIERKFARHLNDLFKNSHSILFMLPSLREPTTSTTETDANGQSGKPKKFDFGETITSAGTDRMFIDYNDDYHFSDNVPYHQMHSMYMLPDPINFRLLYAKYYQRVTNPSYPERVGKAVKATLTASLEVAVKLGATLGYTTLITKAVVVGVADVVKLFWKRDASLTTFVSQVSDSLGRTHSEVKELVWDYANKIFHPKGIKIWMMEGGSDNLANLDFTVSACSASDAPEAQVVGSVSSSSSSSSSSKNNNGDDNLDF